MIVQKLASSTDGAAEFVLSDATVDRYGDIVEPSGWDLTNFKSNPIALFGHNSGFPIGRWENIRVEAGKLVGRLALAKRGTSERLDEMISLVEQGILRTISVGFRPLEWEPIDPKLPHGGQRYKMQELLEASLVSVPANPAAVALAKSLNISPETLAIAFGEQAETKRRALGEPGEHAESQHSKDGCGKMKTLSQRIEDAQNDMNLKRDKLAELTSADNIDPDAIEEATRQVEEVERAVTVLKGAEAKIGLTAAPAGAPASPAVARRPLGYPQKEVDGFDLMVRAAVVNGVSLFTGKSVDKVLDERYPGHEATAIIAKADQTIGTTGTSGWASELVQTVNQGFLHALTGYSIYPELYNRGIGLNFDGVGTVTIPRRTAGTAGGGFVAEGSPIRVGKLTTAAASLTPKKMGVIIPFSKELTKRANPAIESLVRRAILEDTASVLDPLVLDATASSAARPAGLLNGVSAAASGYGGGDYVAVKEDFKSLLQPFIDANAADGITVIMNSGQGLAISLMDGPDNNSEWFQKIRDRVTLIESTHATANRLIAIRNTDFATAISEGPEFDISEQATIHMEDTTPLEIVSGTGPTTADPVRSLWQTNSVGIRMLMDVSWVMARPSMVQWIDGTTY
jgi:HK97 family phage major capsid protein/HK97 family phage prohead protease